MLCKITIYFLYLIFFSINIAIAEDEEEKCSIVFSEELEECDGFKNDFLKMSTMVVKYDNSNANGSTISMTGTINLLKSVDDEYQLEIRLSKVAGSSCSDIMWVGANNICGALKDTNAPWYPVAQQLNLEECPIVEAEYVLDNILIDGSSASDFCSPEMMGDYCVQLSVLNTLNDPIICYVTYVAIEEPEY